MNGLAPLMSRASDEWETPHEFFAVANAQLGPFTLDAAATQANAKCQRYLTDALGTHPWGRYERIWLNPPYSQIARFTDRALIEADDNAIWMLVPARTDTQWWHRLTADAKVFLLKGRLKFGDGTGSAPFPSALVHPKALEPGIRNLDWRKAWR